MAVRDGRGSGDGSSLAAVWRPHQLGGALQWRQLGGGGGGRGWAAAPAWHGGGGNGSCLAAGWRRPNTKKKQENLIFQVL